MDPSTWAWTRLDFPGAEETDLYGTDGGTIVGTYGDAAGSLHGFTYSSGIWRTLDYPGSSSTNVRGISGTNVVGS